MKFDDMTKEQQEAWKELVIARLRAMPDNIRISIGWGERKMKKLTKQERFEIVEQTLSMNFLSERQRLVFMIGLIEIKLANKNYGKVKQKWVKVNVVFANNGKQKLMLFSISVMIVQTDANMNILYK